MIGVQYGNYRVVEKLGAGGMGEVYVAEHTLLGSKAVVKILHVRYADEQDVLDRFFNEARAATRIKHAGIVQVFDFGTHPDTGAAYLVMELLEGESLRQRLTRIGQMSPHTAMTITRQLATTLAATHAATIIHRDLKPDNIFLVEDAEVAGGERAKILDFGVAKLTQSLSGRQTKTGAVLGTPQYMSPEQCENAGAVDGRTDIYALGCMLYEMVTGTAPFRGVTFGETISAHLFAAIPVASETAPEVPAALDRIITRALAKDPDGRQSSMSALAAELDAALRAGSSPSMRHEQATATTASMSLPAIAAPTELDAPRRSRLAIIGAAAVACVAIAVGVVYAARSGSSSDGSPPAASATIIAPSAPSTEPVLPVAAPVVPHDPSPLPATEPAPVEPPPTKSSSITPPKRAATSSASATSHLKPTKVVRRKATSAKPEPATTADLAPAPQTSPTPVHDAKPTDDPGHTTINPYKRP